MSDEDRLTLKEEARVSAALAVGKAQNVMRHEYRVLSDLEKHQMRTIKDMGFAFFNYCDAIGHGRELSLAKTKVEEAVMWAVKHITR